MMVVSRRSASLPKVLEMKRVICSKYAAVARGPVSTTGNGCSRLAGSSRIPVRYRISSAVPAPPGNTTMPCARRTNASRRFSMSGMIASWLTMGLGGSAAMIPGSVTPM